MGYAKLARIPVEYILYDDRYLWFGHRELAREKHVRHKEFEKPFRRARRTLRHLWHIKRGDKHYDPNSCDGCKEIHLFLTDPNYRGDEQYPVGVESDPDLGPSWKLGPDEIEIKRNA